MARKTKKSKSGKISVNFKGIETRVLLPENDYRLGITNVEEKDDQVHFTFEVLAGKYKGKTAHEYFSTKPQALWRLGNFLVACGLDLPDGELEFDASDFEDVTVMGVGTHEEYEGKTKQRWDFYPDDGEGSDDEDGDDSSDDDEDEGDKKSKGKSKKSKVEKVSADDVNGADKDGLEEIIENTGIDCDLDDYKGIKKQRAAVLEALEEADLLAGDDEDEADEDEDDKKSKSKKSKGKKAEKVDGSSVDDMDEEELEALIEEHELEVDLDDHKTLRKKVRAVKDALEEKDLLEE